MRNLPPGVAISVIAHAAVVAVLTTRSATTPAGPSEPPAVTPIEIVAVAPAETPAMELAIEAQSKATPEAVPEERISAVPVPAPALPPAPSPEPPRRRPAPEVARVAPIAPDAPDPRDRAGAAGAPDARAAIEAAAGATAAGPGDAAATAPAAPGLLRMRRGGAPRLDLPAGRWDALDHVPRGTGPEADRTTGILRPSGRGTHSSDQGPFVGTVAADGSVTLRDKRNLQVGLRLPRPKQIGRALADWYTSDKGPHGNEGDTSMGKHIQASGSSTVDPEDRTPTVIIPVLGGGFDVTDWLMRSNGSDPYASKKLAFLDATRDERVQLGKRHRAQQLALTPQIVRTNLEALWAATPDPAARRRALFELWDECAETGDPAVVAGGAAARRMVIGFIRARLPAGSSGAFTPAELAELARGQRSTAVFQPYE